MAEAAAAGTVNQPAAASAYGYAGFWRRVGAFLIDYLVFAVVLWAVATLALMVLAVTPGLGGAVDPDYYNLGVDLLAQLIVLVVAWLYSALQESSSRQATIGKRALGMIVTTETGERLSFARASGRFFGKILSGMIMAVGYLMVAFTARKQGLHDMLAGTLVLHRDLPPPQPPVPTVHTP